MVVVLPSLAMGWGPQVLVVFLRAFSGSLFGPGAGAWAPLGQNVKGMDKKLSRRRSAHDVSQRFSCCSKLWQCLPPVENPTQDFQTNTFEGC